MKRFYTYRQGADDTNNEHYDKLNNLVDVLKSYGWSIGTETLLVEADDVWKRLDAQGRQDDSNIELLMKRNEERFLAFALIAKSDNNRYGELKTELENDYTMGSNRYPTTMTKALHLLTNYKPSRPVTQQSSNNVSFAQKGKKGNNNNKNNGDKDDSWHKDAICHHCKKKGHIKPNCPDLDKTFNNNGEEESQ